jgi:hypothetical protein
MPPSSQRKRPCSECGHWFRPSPRLKGRQTTCSKADCQRERRAANVRRWKRATVRMRSRTTTYDEVPRSNEGNSILVQAPMQQGLDRRDLPVALGNSIHAQARVLVALVARVPPGGGGNSIRARISELHAQGRVLLGEI